MIHQYLDGARLKKLEGRQRRRRTDENNEDWQGSSFRTRSWETPIP